MVARAAGIRLSFSKTTFTLPARPSSKNIEMSLDSVHKLCNLPFIKSIFCLFESSQTEFLQGKYIFYWVNAVWGCSVTETAAYLLVDLLFSDRMGLKQHAKYKVKNNEILNLSNMDCSFFFFNKSSMHFSYKDIFFPLKPQHVTASNLFLEKPLTTCCTEQLE